MNRGKLLIVGILAVATGMSAFAWWFHRQQGQRVLAFWGSDVAYLIRYAERVELLQLGANAAGGEEGRKAEVLDVAGVGPIMATGVRDITKVRGLVHARQAFIEDASFAWNESREEALAIAWRYGLRFSEGADSVVLLLSADCNEVRTVTDKRVAFLTIGDGLRTFVDEQNQG